MLRQTSHSKNKRHNQHNILNCIRYFRVCLFCFHLNIFLNFKYIRFSSSANYTFFGCNVFLCVRATVLLWLFVWLILIWFNLQAHGDEKGFNLAINVNETNFICRWNGIEFIEWCLRSTYIWWWYIPFLQCVIFCHTNMIVVCLS